MFDDFIEWIEWNFWEAVVIGGLVLGMIVILILVWYGISKEQREWELFAKDHNCVVIGEESASVGISSDGKAITIPAKTTYKCNDGKTYTR